jgi:hypothetical protein
MSIEKINIALNFTTMLTLATAAVSIAWFIGERSRQIDVNTVRLTSLEVRMMELEIITHSIKTDINWIRQRLNEIHPNGK